MAHDGTGADWDITAPADVDAVASGAQEIRDLRRGVETRVNREHTTLATSSAGGWHKSGSAKAYYQASGPTQRPDASTALTADDNGRLFVDSDDNKLYVYIYGTGWVQIKALIDTNTITNAMLTDDCVTNAEIADNAVDTAQIVDNAVTSAKIPADAITTAKILDAAITLAKLDSGIRLRGYKGLFEDRKASGTDGGTPTTLTWTKHDLGTEVYDEGTLFSVSSSVVTIPAGTYHVRGAVMFRDVNSCVARLRDTTNNATLALGLTARSPSGEQIMSEFEGFFTVAGSTNLEVQYYVAAAGSGSQSLGMAVNSGELEVYARLYLEKLS